MEHNIFRNDFFIDYTLTQQLKLIIQVFISPVTI